VLYWHVNALTTLPGLLPAFIRRYFWLYVCEPRCRRNTTKERNVQSLYIRPIRSA